MWSDLAIQQSVFHCLYDSTHRARMYSEVLTDLRQRIGLFEMCLVYSGITIPLFLIFYYLFEVRFRHNITTVTTQ